MKNYLFLGIASIATVIICLSIFSYYNESKQKIKNYDFIDNVIPEIKTTNLDGFLSETPDTIILVTDKTLEKEYLVEMVALFGSHNILNELVYLNRNDLKVKDLAKIKKLLNHEIEENNYLLFIRDFIIEENYGLEDKELDELDNFIKIKGYYHD